VNTHEKGALHYQEITDWSKKLKQGRAFIIGPPGDNPFPGCIVYGRTYMDDNEAAALIMMGEAGAEIWFAKFKDQYIRCGYVEAWATPNEPSIDTQIKRTMLVRFTLRLTQLMHGINKNVIVGNWSVTWPFTGVGMCMELAPLLAGAKYVGFHEYGYPRMATDHVGEKCLHYRAVRAEWIAGGVKEKDIPPFIIDESGEDDGHRHGWKTATGNSEPTFLADLQWYSDEVSKDDYVLAFCVFTAGPQGWGDFEVTETLGKAIASPTAFVPPVVVVPPPLPVATRLIQPLLAWPLGAVAGSVTQEFGCDLRWGTSSVDYSWVKMPMPNGQVLSMAGHNGRDIAAPLGTPIYATHAGVCWVYDDPGGYGLTVEVWDPKIDGGSAFKTIYGHMSKQSVVHGQPVAAGAKIGEVGTTGNSTGYHCHFGFKLLQGNCPAYRGWIDPKPFMNR
jgi:Peptidase family M23